MTPAVVNTIVNNTNTYATTARAKRLVEDPLFDNPTSFGRPWKPVCATDIWRYIGIQLYMGMNIKGRREDYWLANERLTKIMSIVRWEQIHRYFTLRDRLIYPYEEDECFAWPVEPVATEIKRNIQKVYIPGSHIAIDEAMIAFRGRTKHTVNLPNKPIKEGYKVWAQGQAGFIDDWLWHSRENGPEGISSKGLDVKRAGAVAGDSDTTIRLAPTFALIIRLAERLRKRYPDRVFCYFLDNLFLNLDVAQSLLAMQMLCCGTTRKNATGIPKWLIKLKDNNRGLVWNSALGETVEQTLCFAWQDNNLVLGITTAHDFKNELVYRERRRPAPTSTNARIVRPIFGGLAKMWLWIPKAIDDYNHYMNAVDVANQFRGALTCHRRYERRNWRPIWNWLLDLCRVNAYLLSNRQINKKQRRGQRPFVQEVTERLLMWPYEEEVPLHPSKFDPEQKEEHKWVIFTSRKNCLWCVEQLKKTQDPQSAERVALAPIVNGVRPRVRKRASQSLGGCSTCQITLCREPCFDQFHSS